MNITQFKQAVMLCREAGVSPWGWGHRGIGKSSAVKQLADELGIGFIDFRCSQIEASDLRGLPDKQDGRTVYFPPEDLPRTYTRDEVIANMEQSLEGKTPEEKEEAIEKWLKKSNSGILFLDELNRAEDDVLQAAFQLVLDRRIGTYVLPSGWSMVVAGNYPEGYNTNNFNDAAFLDRFCHLNIDANNDQYVEDWVTYMTKYEDATKILQFIGANIEHLTGSVEGQLDFSIQPSPRSWEFIARVDEVAEKYPADVVQLVRAGLIGHTLALQYEEFSCRVFPKQIINDGVKVLKSIDLTRNEMNGLVWGVAASAKDASQLNDKQRENVLDFWMHIANSVERDLAVTFGVQLMKNECGEIGAAVVANPHLSKLLNTQIKKNASSSWVAIASRRADLISLMEKTAWGGVMADAK